MDCPARCQCGEWHHEGDPQVPLGGARARSRSRSDHHVTCAGVIDPPKPFTWWFPLVGWFSLILGWFTPPATTAVRPRGPGAAFHFATPSAARQSNYFKEGQDPNQIHRLVLLEGEDEGTGIAPYVEQPDPEAWMAMAWFSGVVAEVVGFLGKLVRDRQWGFGAVMKPSRSYCLCCSWWVAEKSSQPQEPIVLTASSLESGLWNV